AGKAHPQDGAGKVMVQQWTQFIQQHPDLAGRVVFIADYDMLVAEQLVQGVDLWLNTPRRPWEASGTSGMKVLVNGGLNLSELDGWWAEAYAPELGWALGDRQEHNSDLAWDAHEAEELYRLLEDEVVPLFYHNRDANGCPCGWVAKMRASMGQLTPRFSSNRMVREYVEQLYLPAAHIVAARADRSQVERICQWQRELDQHWERIHFGELQISQDAGMLHFHVPVYLDDLDAANITVELYALASEGQSDEVLPMTQGEALAGAVNSYRYHCQIPARRPASDYTPRIVPSLAGCQVPMEAQQILWYR
ncbi:MAG: alpha-glucan family phosphorylase, partial [Acidithiobacillus sp.]